MDNEKMMAVFTELLENQKEITRSQKEIMGAFQELKIQMEGIERGMKNQKASVTPVDIKPIQKSLERGITDIRLSIHRQLQKQEPNNWRIFLESDAKKWVVILLVAVTFLTYLYLFGMHKY